jgi:hypothetical protein
VLQDAADRPPCRPQRPVAQSVDLSRRSLTWWRRSPGTPMLAGVAAFHDRYLAFYKLDQLEIDD